MAKLRKREKRRRLAFEALEVRDLLAAFNVPWPEANSLTLSFAKDGTAIGKQTSELFQTLGAGAASSTWHEEILRAFQTWAVESNINIGLVPDNGEAFGTVGLKQGDLRFGDVRVGAFPMDSDVLAVADPYDPFVANTWVGDVFFNSGMAFSSGAQPSGYDVYSVAVHEAGHVLGIGHSSDPASPMYPQFRRATEASLTSDDIAALRALYGARPADRYDAAADNGGLDTATPLDLTTSGSDVDADITKLTDKDFYRFVAPANAQALDVKLEAAGRSLLVPHLSIVDANGKTVAEATADGPLNNDVHLSLQGLAPGQTYYIAVDSGRSDVFGIGAYHLEVETNSAGENGYAASADNSLGSAAVSPELLATTPGYVEHTYYEIESLLSDATPERSFVVRSADLGPDMTNVMTVVLTVYDTSSRPTASVFDDQGQAVAANVIYNAGGKLEIQIPSVASNKDYRVDVGGSQLSSTPSEYELEVDFAQDGAHLQTFVNDTLSASQPEVARTLTVAAGQQFHFAFAASDWSNPLESGTQMTVENAAGQIVFAMNVADGSTRSGDVFLSSGIYTVRFHSPQLPSGGLITFQLSGLTVSESLGPQLRDTTLDPEQPPAQESIGDLSFYWLPYGASQPRLANTDSQVDLIASQGESLQQQSRNISWSTASVLLADKLIGDAGRGSETILAVRHGSELVAVPGATSQGMHAEQRQSFAAADKVSLTTRSSRLGERASRQEESPPAGRVGSSALDTFFSHWMRESAADIAAVGVADIESGHPQAAQPPIDDVAASGRGSQSENSPSSVAEESNNRIDHRVAVFCVALFACLALPVQRPSRILAAWEAAVDGAYLRWPRIKRLFRRDA